jgi:dTDP-4-amino-4,6-dideoxygalactose transaminase
VRVPRGRRDALRTHLTQEGIGHDVYYPLGLHRQRCFAEAARDARLPETEAAAAEVLALPLYPELREEQRERVVAALLAGLGA